MTKPTQAQFICYALSHAKRETLPDDALLPCSPDAVGTDPWEYLYGTTGTKITKALLDERFEHYYSKKGWTRDAYDELTKNWVGRTSTDCQGLPDSFLGTDVTANYNYVSWCTEKGAISEINRPFVIGEAVFFQNSEGRMTHVGFLCGFLDGEPLVVEARGIRYGVVTTKFSERPWTHRGLMTKKLDYSTPVTLYDEPSTSPVVFALTTPHMTGDNVLALQRLLLSVGYTDHEDKPLKPDGDLGKRTAAALDKFVAAHAAAPEPHVITICTEPLTVSIDGEEAHTSIADTPGKA